MVKQDKSFELESLKKYIDVLYMSLSSLGVDSKEREFQDLVKSLTYLKKELAEVVDAEDFFNHKVNELEPHLMKVFEFSKMMDEANGEDFDDEDFDDEDFDEDEDDEDEDFEEEDFDEVEYENYKESRELCEDWIEGFINSPLYMKLSESAKENAYSILDDFIDCMLQTVDTDPLAWTAENLEQTCTEVILGEIAVKIDYYENLGPVLAQFFKFLHERKLLPQALELAERAKLIQETIVSEAADPINWTADKTVGMVLLETGIDLNDKQQWDKFVKTCGSKLSKTKK